MLNKILENISHDGRKFLGKNRWLHYAEVRKIASDGASSSRTHVHGSKNIEREVVLTREQRTTDATVALQGLCPRLFPKAYSAYTWHVSRDTWPRCRACNETDDLKDNDTWPPVILERPCEFVSDTIHGLKKIYSGVCYTPMCVLIAFPGSCVYIVLVLKAP